MEDEKNEKQMSESDYKKWEKRLYSFGFAGVLSFFPISAVASKIDAITISETPLEIQRANSLEKALQEPIEKFFASGKTLEDYTRIKSDYDALLHHPGVREQLNDFQHPGLFADVRVILPAQENVITVPQSAISYSLYGDSVYVIEEKGKDKKGEPNLIAVQEFVKVGDRQDNSVAITSGITVGESIVTTGQIKLHPDARVVVNNAVELK